MGSSLCSGEEGGPWWEGTVGRGEGVSLGVCRIMEVISTIKLFRRRLWSVLLPPPTPLPNSPHLVSFVVVRISLKLSLCSKEKVHQQEQSGLPLSCEGFKSYPNILVNNSKKSIITSPVVQVYYDIYSFTFLEESF